jgi:hypothetical protein
MAAPPPPIDSGFPDPPAFYRLYSAKADVQPPAPPAPIEGKLELFGLEVDQVRGRGAPLRLQGPAAATRDADEARGLRRTSPWRAAWAPGSSSAGARTGA